METSKRASHQPNPAKAAAPRPGRRRSDQAEIAAWTRRLDARIDKLLQRQDLFLRSLDAGSTHQT